MQRTFRSIFAVLLILSSPALAQETGLISGTLIDDQTGDALVGATVFLQDTRFGTTCDLDGAYRLNDVPPGTYTLVVTMIGYHELRIEEVVVTADEVTKLDLTLQSEAIEIEEAMVVTAKAVRNTEAVLLKDRQKAPAVSDAISAEDISRAGSGDAAEAMKHVTGASVVDGKYVYIRGLGDRYSTVQLNGSQLPSSDPDKKTVPMDIFPSGLLNNIVTTKSSTPDKPGNFTGGAVNIGTKNFPDKFNLAVSTSTSYNTQTTLKDGFLTYKGGNLDWIGFDDGTRDLPDIVPGSEAVPQWPSAASDPDEVAAAAQLVDQISNSFTPEMVPSRDKAPVNQSYSIAAGNQITFAGRPLGLLGTLTYGRSFKSVENGMVARWKLTGNVENTHTLSNNYNLVDSKGSEEVLWGGLLNLAYKFTPNHELSLTNMYNRSSDNTARTLNGFFDELREADIYQTQVLQFKERQLQSLQLSGKHHFATLANTRLEWLASNATSFQNEPDLRYFTSHSFTRNEDTYYLITQSKYPLPTRYFRELDEGNREFQADVSVPINHWREIKGTFKFGASYLGKERQFRERRLEYDLRASNIIPFEGDPTAYLAPANMGIVDSSSTGNGTNYEFGHILQDATDAASNYDGDQTISAGYAMFDMPLLPQLRAIFGTRLEATRVEVASQDTTKVRGNLDKNDLLPSLNLVYALSGKMNLRTSYGRTIARPTFRELAPYASFDFAGGFTFIGNPELKRTTINNLDFRWEWFPTAGEIYAVSLFYKDFSKPIERAIVATAGQGQVQFQNVDEARVTGVEFELRKSLAQLQTFLKHVHAGANLSLVDSEVTIPESELLTQRAVDANAKSTRSLQGQSPFLLNLDLTYDNFYSGTSTGIYYNIYGRRLSEVSLGGTPNVFEEPRATLDYTFSQKVNSFFSFKISAKNLLNSKTRLVYPFKDIDYVAQEYKQGRTFSLGMSYKVN